MQFESFLDAELHTLPDKGLLRCLKPFSKRDGAYVWDTSGKKFLNFISNDYLGLASEQDPAAAPYWYGAGGSRLLGGDNIIADQLESMISESLGFPSALLFNSGYHMNIGVISTLFGPEDVIFCDKLAHASLLDGSRLSGAKLLRFRHNDMTHLETLLRKERKKYRHALIVTESIFSMDGDTSPLDELVSLKTAHNTLLMVDDAHGVGLFGPRGFGLLEDRKGIDIGAGTFGKALGSYGGYIVCSETIRTYLINKCRSFIFSTALPESIYHRNYFAWSRLPELTHTRQHVLQLATMFRNKISDIQTCLGSHHIIPVLTADAKQATELECQFLNAGIWVSAIRPPTVPPNGSRLRFCITAYHNDSHIQEVCNVFKHSLSKI